MNDLPKHPDHDKPKHIVGTGGFDHVKRNGTPVMHGKESRLLVAPGRRFWKLKHWLQERLTKKQVIIGGAVFVLLLGAAVAYGLVNRANAPTKAPAVAKKRVVPPVVITSPLTGLPVTAAQASHIVTGVMIENSDFARPQSGLKEAGVVFEAIAEGGVTRFMALFQEATPDNVGPIRSARPYYLQWLLGFDAPLAHVGGSPDALADIRSWGVKDLDQFANGGSYHRISQRDAPHNVYTSIATLNTLEANKGWTTSAFTGFARKKDSPSKTPNATTLDFSISGPDYYAHYDYDAAANAYLRSEGGAKHLDATSGSQLEPKVAIAMVVPLSQGALDATGAYYSDYAVVGSGKVYIFQDGTVTIGTWQKSSATNQVQFLDAAGKPIGLNAGQTWLTAVSSDSQVTYTGPPAQPAKQ